MAIHRRPTLPKMDDADAHVGSTHRRATSRWLFGAAAVALALASCTTEQSTSPGPTLTTTTSTTDASPSSTEPAAADTTAAPTTAAETTTSTTTLPSGPSDATVTLLVGGSEGGWLPLGSWERTAWAEAPDDGGLPIAAGTTMTVTDLGGDRSATAGDEVEACFDERTGPTLDVTISPPEPPGFGYAAVATTGHGRALHPRPIAVTAAGPDAYRSLGEAAFSGEPVDAALGEVVQVVVGDLDGDGDDEAVVVFERSEPTAGTGSPGDLSAVLIVDATSRTAETVLTSHVPSDLPPDAFPFIERFRVIDVSDHNGDGKMEVAVHAWYYEGASVLLFEYDGTSLDEVLATGCGA